MPISDVDTRFIKRISQIEGNIFASYKQDLAWSRRKNLYQQRQINLLFERLLHLYQNFFSHNSSFSVKIPDESKSDRASERGREREREKEAIFLYLHHYPQFGVL